MSLLDSWLNGLPLQFLTGENLVRPQTALDQLLSLVSGDEKDLGFDFAPNITQDQTPFSEWLSWGDLYTTYQIEQYAFLAFEP